MCNNDYHESAFFAEKYVLVVYPLPKVTNCRKNGFIDLNTVTAQIKLTICSRMTNYHAMQETSYFW